MGDVVGVVALFAVPFAVFVWAQWRREERDRERRRNQPAADDGSPPSRDSYWGGMGRPGGRH